MAQAHKLDALVLLGSCDKIVPGMLMAAARLDIPAIFVPGGPMLGGIEFDGRKTDLTSLDEARAMLSSGKISEDEFYALEDLCGPSCGSCSFFGTANTMCCLAEALGMTLPGGALIPAVHPDRMRLAQASGRAICEMTRCEVGARKILCKEALENAVKVCLAIGGSTNAVLHLPAIAYEAEIEVDIIEAFSRFNKTTPYIAKVNPASKWDMEDFWRAGGIPRVMANMQPLLDAQAMTCTMKTVAENLAGYRYRFPENPQVIRTLAQPFSPTGGLAVLRGNLAPDTAISKPGAIDPSVRRFTGTARVYDSEELANEAILDGRVVAGDVVVIRYEGPKGGPGMREMYKAMKFMYGRGLAKTAALVTDGRFSGTNNGCFVGHVSPEAAEGGPIAIVRDGDRITIDVDAGVLHLDLTDQKIKDRTAAWHPPEPKIKRGYLALYAKLASSASQGAVIRS
jgi:dihydroxy-acid dehydratase